MRNLFYLSAVAAMLVPVMACSHNTPQQPDDATPDEQTEPVVEKAVFDAHKGINISCWLSQTSSRKGSVETYFTEKEVKILSDWGFDHIRLPIDEKEVFTEDLKWKDAARQYIHKAIGWCEKHNMRVILDLHILRSHYFNNTETMTLWKDKASQDRMMQMWQMISDEFKKYPVDLLAYELLNEPVPDTPAQWNTLSAKLIAQIRKAEPDRMLIIDPSSHASIGALSSQTVPEGDKNLMFAIHFYTPHLLTHYKASWMSRLKNLTVPLNYPGQLVAKEIVDTIKNSNNLRVVNYYNGNYNKDVLAQTFEAAFEKSRQTGLRLIVSEVGCIDNAPEEPKVNWFADVAAICKEHDLAFSVWGYKASFGLFNENGTVKNERIMEALTK